MTTLFVLYWMINMCYVNLAPQGGHGAAYTEKFHAPLDFPPAFKLAS